MMKNPRYANNQRARGVTLIELMIVVVTISIIAAFAYPSYMKQAQRAGRSDATSALLAIAAAQEQEFIKNNAYTNDLDELGITETDAGKYTLSVTTPETGGFIATATAGTAEDSSQVGDTDCKIFTINHIGVKRSSDGSENTTGCW